MKKVRRVRLTRKQKTARNGVKAPAVSKYAGRRPRRAVLRIGDVAIATASGSGVDFWPDDEALESEEQAPLMGGSDE